MLSIPMSQIDMLCVYLFVHSIKSDVGATDTGAHGYCTQVLFINIVR